MIYSIKRKLKISEQVALDLIHRLAGFAEIDMDWYCKKTYKNLRKELKNDNCPDAYFTKTVTDMAIENLIDMTLLAVINGNFYCYGRYISVIPHGDKPFVTFFFRLLDYAYKHGYITEEQKENTEKYYWDNKKWDEGTLWKTDTLWIMK